MKNILILGGTGFIGINLTYGLLDDAENIITVFGRNFETYPFDLQNHPRVISVQGVFHTGCDFDSLVKGQDMVFHLVSTTVPATSNKNVAEEIINNIESTSYLLEACARNTVKRIVFISSGGTVYGVTESIQIPEDMPTNPITSYGMQKLSIEKLLHLYYCMYGLDYRIIRLSNPYGPYQKIEGIQGVVAAFLYNVLNGKRLTVYGDGSIVRDYIYIDDAVRAILNISCKVSRHRLYNVGSGTGISLKEIIRDIEQVLGQKADVKYIQGRNVDVPINILDVDRYEMEFGSISKIDFISGLKKTAEFIQNMKNKNKVLFSIFMCARNAESTIGRAVDSVLRQTCADWELLIVDNGSTDGTWAQIEDSMRANSRIKGIHLEQGVGWAKGAGLCLERARGNYMIFLAADDFFLGDGGLSAVEKCIETEEADIVWVGHNMVQLDAQSYQVVGGTIPEYKVYDGEDRVNEVFEIMNHLYYNSFFHFIRVELLREHGIDFFEPFFADYEGVTEAMCRAGRMAVLNQAVYALTVNTSQTSGTITWKQNIMQWRSVKNAVCEKGKYSREKLSYIAIRIFNNNMSMIKSIAEGAPVRDREMNPVSKTALERLQYVEEALEIPEFHEIFYYAGAGYYTDSLFECVKISYEKCREAGYSEQKISQDVKWVDKLLLGFYRYDGEKLVKRTVYDAECFEYIRQALCNEYNAGMFGYELVGEMVSSVTEEVLGIWQEITNAYIECSLKRIYQQLFLAVEIKKRGRMPEVLEIVKECTELLRQIKQHVPDEDLRQLTQDLKMVMNTL